MTVNAIIELVVNIRLLNASQKDLLLDLVGHFWVGPRNLHGGAKFAPKINQAIEQARQVIVVLSPNTVNSSWVRKEIQKALEVEKQRKDVGYRVIPLLLPGIEPSALPLWFDEEPVGTLIQLGPGGLSTALIDILSALGECLPIDSQKVTTPPSKPIEKLLLELINLENRGD